MKYKKKGVFFKILFWINLYTPHGAQTYNPETKSHLLYELSQSHAPKKEVFNS